jgi:prepilin-type N-terminal cleavage/methylation domain-containing protein
VDAAAIITNPPSAKSTPPAKKNIKMKTQQSPKAGFTLVEIMIVVAIIGLLAAIAIPNFVKARATAQKNACIANMKQIEGAVQQWALEQKKVATSLWTITEVTLLPFMKGSLMPTCPATGSAYVGSTVAGNPTCSNSALGHTL